MGSGKTRNVGGDSKTKKRHKLGVRKKFEERHVDQVWEDMRKLPAEVHDGKFGPTGTTSKAELDEDTPGYGKHYCIPCRWVQGPPAYGWGCRPGASCMGLDPRAHAWAGAIKARWHAPAWACMQLLCRMHPVGR